MRTPVISLGAGVQSSAMLLMAARGELMGGVVPELALFADTQWEPAGVYTWLEQLEEEVRGRVEIVRVTAGDLRAETARFAGGEGSRHASPPLYTRRRVPCSRCGGSGRLGGDGEQLDLVELLEARGDRECEVCEGRTWLWGDGRSILRRQCTKDYKLRPIWRELRDRGFGPRSPVAQWIGISTDEIERMKPSKLLWATTEHPLIDAEMSRSDCERWLIDHGYPVPEKSACIGCPFHDNATWRAMKRERPADFEEAVQWDRAIRRLPRLDSPAFVHSSLRPLDEVDFDSGDDAGQLQLMDECEGGCFL